jgi:hypothetical protein
MVFKAVVTAVEALSKLFMRNYISDLDLFTNSVRHSTLYIEMIRDRNAENSFFFNKTFRLQ